MNKKQFRLLTNINIIQKKINGVCYEYANV